MTNKTPRYWNIARSKDGRTATIDLSGEIRDERPTDWWGDAIEGNYYTSQDLKDDLAGCSGCDEVVVNINSIGGDIYVGLAIHNALKALPCKVKTVIHGIAASAASVIFCAGEEREVFNGSLLMVHGVSGAVQECGYYNEHDLDEAIRNLRSMRSALQTMNEAVASIYAATTKKTKEECLSLISGASETWMTGADAIEEGFATGYTAAEEHAEPLRMVACGGKTALYCGSKLITNDFNAPKNAADLGIKLSASAPAAVSANTTQSTTMDTETTKTPEAAPAPAVDAAAVAAQARKAERERMAAINALSDKLGDRVSKDLVARALNGDETHEDGMTPQEFAYAAVMALQPEQPKAPAPEKVNNAFLEARAAELAQGGKVNTAAPAEVQDANAENNGLRILARLDAAKANAKK